ncbi:MAG: hypothetical protein JWP46_3456 [Modestobacter sp.]|jgi:hypothetical protein|nr:hypothetical protein [Modestobacter sp.]MCW2678497.1 hypothetical protein [Modestobacter sp.]
MRGLGTTAAVLLNSFLLVAFCVLWAALQA